MPSCPHYKADQVIGFIVVFQGTAVSRVFYIPGPDKSDLKYLIWLY
jgi:hypothetical protein